jgi:hypothetical protein
MRAIDRNLSDIPDVATQLFRTLWPAEVVPDTFTLISDRLKGAGRRIREWQCSAARAGADSALRVACSWYPELNLDALTGVHEGAETDLDPVLTAKRQDRAYHIAEYADVRTFIPPLLTSRTISTRRRMKPMRSLWMMLVLAMLLRKPLLPDDLLLNVCLCYVCWSCLSQNNAR